VAIRIGYPTLAGLEREICRDMSVGGMFIESPTPPNVGSVVDFELTLPTPDPWRVHGSGRVVWQRPPGDSTPRPAGFGLQFVDLDRRFRELIFRVVDRYIQKGGTPFDLGEAR
jgi:uncharacterized protein (TIGR02266 family)